MWLFQNHKTKVTFFFLKMFYLRMECKGMNRMDGIDGISKVSFIFFILRYTKQYTHLNLNCYIGKKVQKNFLMGLKIWWSWGSGFFFSKSQQVGRFLDFRPKLKKKTSEQVDAHFEWKFQIFRFFFLKCLVLHVLCPSLSQSSLVKI